MSLDPGLWPWTLSPEESEAFWGHIQYLTLQTVLRIMCRTVYFVFVLHRNVNVSCLSFVFCCILNQFLLYSFCLALFPVWALICVLLLIIITVNHCFGFYCSLQDPHCQSCGSPGLSHVHFFLFLPGMFCSYVFRLSALDCSQLVFVFFKGSLILYLYILHLGPYPASHIWWLWLSLLF